MITHNDFTGKTKSRFLCDKCNKELVTGKDDRYRLIVQDPRGYKIVKRWDLCDRCCKLLFKSMRKG